MKIAGFSKVFVSELDSIDPPFEPKLNVYNLDIRDHHHQHCNALPKLPINSIPISAELLNGNLVVFGVNYLQESNLYQCFCIMLKEGVWVALPAPPPSGCLAGAATTTLTLKRTYLLYKNRQAPIVICMADEPHVLEVHSQVEGIQYKIPDKSSIIYSFTINTNATFEFKLLFT